MPDHTPEQLYEYKHAECEALWQVTSALFERNPSALAELRRYLMNPAAEAMTMQSYGPAQGSKVRAALGFALNRAEQQVQASGARLRQDVDKDMVRKKLHQQMDAAAFGDLFRATCRCGWASLARAVKYRPLTNAAGVLAMVAGLWFVFG